MINEPPTATCTTQQWKRTAEVAGVAPRALGNERANPLLRMTSTSAFQQVQGSHGFCVSTPEDGDIFARNKADLFQAMENKERHQ